MSKSDPPNEAVHPRAGLREREAADKLLLCLDFDGTLTPLVSDPDAALLDESVRRTIEAIAAAGVHVAIVSGRALPDLRQRVGLPSLIYAGNHGFEIQGEGIAYRHGDEEADRLALAEFLDGAKSLISQTPGAWIEDKGLTLSVHYRAVDREQVLPLKLGVRARVLACGSSLVCGEGHEVIDIVPGALWNKGLAVRYIGECLQLDEPAKVIYIGDDRTDEDAFQLLSDGVTVKVGDDRESAARYRLSAPVDVAAYLRDLLAIVAKGGS